jgi:signal transduction histidine kinase/CheY-like chemotaxis protein
VVKSWRIIGLGLIATIFIITTMVAIHSVRQHVIEIKESFVTERWWAANQLEKEMLRLQNSLSYFILQPTDNNVNKVIIRFEVLWSRANIILEGVNSRTTEAIEINHLLISTTKKIKQFLAQQEDSFYGLNQDKASVLIQDLSLLSPKIASNVQNQFHMMTNIERLEREDLQRFFFQVIILLVAISILAMGYTIIFLNELKRNKRLVILAQQSTQAKSTFLAKVSHEIRTPLNCILGVIQIFEQRNFDDETRNYLNDVHYSSRMLLASINDLLDFTKLEYGGDKLKFTPVTMKQLLPEILGPLAHLAKAKSITLEHAINPAVPNIILLDQQRISQVITNLVSNAIKFTESGKVKVELNFKPQQGRLSFKCIDSGIGIAPNDAKKIFIPFQQADNSTTREFRGTGLGLTISKQLIEKMSGEIGLYALDQNKSETGSCFWFEIPVDEAPQLTIDPETLQQKYLPLQGCNILVAEDNPLNQKIITVFLEQAGATVTLAADGVIVVSLFKAGFNFELILMDCQMPNMDGYQASREIREIDASIPILAVTAHSFEEEKIKCFEAGMTGFITKPLNKALLYKTILEATDRTF